MSRSDPSQYVVLDTHALYWYWTRSARIGPAAMVALQALETGEVIGLVLGGIPEMHDRFIAATGLLHDAAVISRDADIRACDLVRSIW